MIDPLRPYWPTNRSIAGLLVRSFCLLVAAGAVVLAESRPVSSLVVLVAALAQGSFLVFEWMDFKRARRAGLIAGAIVCFLFLGLFFVLLVECGSVLVSSVR